MNSILEEFARGNISPEPRFFNKSSQYGKTIKVLSDSEEKLLAMLGESEKELLKAFSEAQIEINNLTGIEKFV